MDDVTQGVLNRVVSQNNGLVQFMNSVIDIRPAFKQVGLKVLDGAIIQSLAVEVRFPEDRPVLHYRIPSTTWVRIDGSGDAPINDDWLQRIEGTETVFSAPELLASISRHINKGRDLLAMSMDADIVNLLSPQTIAANMADMVLGDSPLRHIFAVEGKSGRSASVQIRIPSLPLLGSCTANLWQIKDVSTFLTTSGAWVRSVSQHLEQAWALKSVLKSRSNTPDAQEPEEVIKLEF